MKQRNNKAFGVKLCDVVVLCRCVVFGVPVWVLCILSFCHYAVFCRHICTATPLYYSMSLHCIAVLPFHSTVLLYLTPLYSYSISHSVTITTHTTL